MVKKNTENQSIAAAALRCSVGSAKAASTASAGRASISARSEPPMPIADREQRQGAAERHREVPSSSWRRQRQTVHSASGQAGQVNQAISRISETTWPWCR